MSAADVSSQSFSHERWHCSSTEYNLAMLSKARPSVTHLYCQLGTRKWQLHHASLPLHCNAPSKVYPDQPMHMHARESDEMVWAEEHKESANLLAGGFCCVAYFVRHLS
jgi:hypothetical protein